MLDYDIDGWDAACGLVFFVAIVAYLVWRFHILSPYDDEH